MKKIRRINFLGGACCGKSTVAPFVYSQLKMKSYKVALAQEYIKDWAYINRETSGFDQVFIFANQLHKEEIPLKNGEDLIISESPLFLSACYGEKYNTPCYKEIFSIIDHFEQEYPSINIFLERDNIEYASEGRYHSLKESQEIDSFIINKLEEHNLLYHKYKTTEPDKILNFILNIL